jgi:hypothetical protein
MIQVITIRIEPKTETWQSSDDRCKAKEHAPEFFCADFRYAGNAIVSDASAGETHSVTWSSFAHFQKELKRFQERNPNTRILFEIA